MHANGPHKVDDQINRKRQGLPDAGGQRCAFNPHFREWAIAKNQNGVQDNVCDAPAHQADHGRFHVSYCLEQFLKHHADGNNECKGERNGRIADAKFNDHFGCSEHPQKNRHNCDTADCNNNAMNHGKHKSLCGSLICFFVISRAQIEGNHCVDPNTKPNSNRIDKILNRVNQ